MLSKTKDDIDLEVKRLQKPMFGTILDEKCEEETVDLCRKVKEGFFELRQELVRKGGFGEKECENLSLHELVFKTFDSVERKYSIYFAKENAKYKKELDEKMVKTEENEGKVKELTRKLKQHKSEENILREENQKLKVQIHELEEELHMTREEKATLDSEIGNVQIQQEEIENVGNLEFMSASQVRRGSSYSLQNAHDLDIVVEAKNVRVMSAKSRHKVESCRSMSGRTVRSQSVPSEGSQLSIGTGERTDRPNGVTVNYVYHIHHCNNLSFKSG